MTTNFRVLGGTLPRLKFGRAYRLRARTVDLANNSLAPDDALAGLLEDLAALPRRTNLQPGHVVYLRYEPVPAPLLAARDERAVTGPGSALDRLVIRSFNSDPSLDASAADPTWARATGTSSRRAPPSTWPKNWACSTMRAGA
ncbi:hypothetical protein SE17_44175 [Kouleothrix aurantiaca]|uniref:Uncharacterized protein n=1 Tax=Kouleothrix aurantiaca TaxID=186479 RepID=A0A0N8PPN2_9CHLR|nr:hypothetical protein SE17_44175 [Kouleothrix aurantiaca]